MQDPLHEEQATLAKQLRGQRRAATALRYVLWALCAALPAAAWAIDAKQFRTGDTLLAADFQALWDAVLALEQAPVPRALVGGLGIGGAPGGTNPLTAGDNDFIEGSDTLAPTRELRCVVHLQAQLSNDPAVPEGSRWTAQLLVRTDNQVAPASNFNAVAARTLDARRTQAFATYPGLRLTPGHQYNLGCRLGLDAPYADASWQCRWTYTCD